MTDARQPIADSLKRQIAAHFAHLEPDKRGALLIIADTQGARAHLAAKLNDHWKVAAEAGVPWGGPVHAAVYVQGAW